MSNFWLLEEREWWARKLRKRAGAERIESQIVRSGGN